VNEPIFLAQKNNHERDTRITFDEVPHIYTIDGDSDFKSVTSWAHSHFPKFNSDLVIDKMMSSPKWPQSPYFGMTKVEIKDKWKKEGFAASEAGTIMHYNIECFYNRMDVEDDGSLEWKYFKEFNSTLSSELLPYRTEWMIWDKRLRLAGSVDMLFETPDGTLHIYDWKRSKEIKKDNRWDSAKIASISHIPDSNFWHYSLQLNTYKWIIEKNYGKKVSKMCLVGLHPNNKNNSFLKYEVDILSQEMESLIELRKRELGRKSISTNMTSIQASEAVDKLAELKDRKKELIADIDAMVNTIESKLINYSKNEGLELIKGKNYKASFSKPVFKMHMDEEIKVKINLEKL